MRTLHDINTVEYKCNLLQYCKTRHRCIVIQPFAQFIQRSGHFLFYITFKHDRFIAAAHSYMIFSNVFSQNYLVRHLKCYFMYCKRFLS